MPVLPVDSFQEGLPLRLFLRILCKHIGETEWDIHGQRGLSTVESGLARLYAIGALRAAENHCLGYLFGPQWKRWLLPPPHQDHSQTLWLAATVKEHGDRHPIPV